MLDHPTPLPATGVTVTTVASFTYGVDHPDADLWLDRDGKVYCGDGPFLNRPLRRLRRALRRWLR